MLINKLLVKSIKNQIYFWRSMRSPKIKWNFFKPKMGKKK